MNRYVYAILSVVANYTGIPSVPVVSAVQAQALQKQCAWVFPHTSVLCIAEEGCFKDPIIVKETYVNTVSGMFSTELVTDTVTIRHGRQGVVYRRADYTVKTSDGIACVRRMLKPTVLNRK